MKSKKMIKIFVFLFLFFSKICRLFHKIYNSLLIAESSQNFHNYTILYRKHYTFSIFRDLYNFSTWSNLRYINLSFSYNCKSFINSNSIFINLQKFSCVTFRIVFLHEFFFLTRKIFLKLYEEIFFSNRTKISHAFKFVRVSFNVGFLDDARNILW